jgi:transketolase
MGNMRMAYGQALVEEGKKDKNIVVLEADLGKSTMSSYFREAFPSRYFEMGIAEQNMASFAAGLASRGKSVFINSFAVFATGRCYDQIRQGIAIAGLKVIIVGSSCGLSDFGDGATHQSIEDMALMTAIPNMRVFSPCDEEQTKRCVKAALEYDGPSYIRLSRSDSEELTDKETNLTSLLEEGDDIAILASGIMVKKALEAKSELAKKGILAKVINVAKIKPLDEKEIRKLISPCKAVLVCEEHSYYGGLFSEIARRFSKDRLLIDGVCIDDVFGQSAKSHEKLLEEYGLDVSTIVKKAMELTKEDLAWR